MRLKIQIETEYVPIIYRHRVVSFIKEALKKSNGSYKDFLYQNKITKPFTFNLVLPKERKSNKTLIKIDDNFSIEDIVFHIKNECLTIYISSLDRGFINSLYRGIKRLKFFDFSWNDSMLVNGKKIIWNIKSITVFPDKTIQNSTVTFKTNSPMIIEDKEDRPVLYNEPEFEECLNEIADRILRAKHIKGTGLSRPLKFEVVEMRKQVVKHTLKDFRDKTGKPVMYLTGNSGVFKLSGDPVDLNILHKIGIGNRTGQGFGMIELVG
ncbi:CRISPR-associated endoribonuclease Cas6 [Persephonella sp.]